VNPAVRWRDIAVPAYGPTVLVSIGQGAILPLVALSARDLGGSVGQAALVVALVGVGQLAGDLPAGALAARIGEQKALVAACAVDAAALLAAFAALAGHRHRSVAAVLAEHRRVLLTLGLGVMVISAARSTRQSIVPLWAESQGIDAATTSLIFGISSGVDMLLFYPGGAIMDRFGRVYVAVPAMLALSSSVVGGWAPTSATPAARW